MKAAIHPARPLKASGLYTAVVERVAIDNVNIAHSTNLAAGDLIQLLGIEALKPFGKTYKAMSPLLLALSINILVPHTRAPEKAQPYGPSQVS